MKQLLAIPIFFGALLYAQSTPRLTDDIITKLVEKPMHCINQEYPNKTQHIINNANEVALSPKDLHPSFYGCFDWHSSVHGHWLLVRTLKSKPNLPISKDLEKILENSFESEKIKAEADYFSKYNLATSFERTYGWAWLLKLDEELLTWDDPRAKRWHQSLQPLTEVIIKSWKKYLPKQTYPNRTGVHQNTAFAMAFAIDWARAAHQKEFENELIEKSKYFYLKDTNAPAYMEPDGSDFFSPSLNIAYLMSRILPQKAYIQWLEKFYNKRSLENVKTIPYVSDLEDYQTVHLVGLYFNRAWNMKGVAKALPNNHPLKKEFNSKANEFISKGLPLLFKGNYGGDHWLASFAFYAMKE